MKKRIEQTNFKPIKKPSDPKNGGRWIFYDLYEAPEEKA
ncbi:hypothetical protein KNP414_06038 [Paenibacillus mucilaginosus KNP414]|uniref:Uncharacterized protein n=1 Tax=Paenibacillus mucilaginosus (strain KNP414) TaxID=1036673 RepID=F8FEG3_PAEMK|nr:hypothetical protein KNP414_06038 [Paenibacillus mucilaginosus KNP414]